MCIKVSLHMLILKSKAAVLHGRFSQLRDVIVRRRAMDFVLLIWCAFSRNIYLHNEFTSLMIKIVTRISKWLRSFLIVDALTSCLCILETSVITSKRCFDKIGHLLAMLFESWVRYTWSSWKRYYFNAILLGETL